MTRASIFYLGEMAATNIHLIILLILLSRSTRGPGDSSGGWYTPVSPVMYSPAPREEQLHLWDLAARTSPLQSENSKWSFNSWALCSEKRFYTENAYLNETHIKINLIIRNQVYTTQNINVQKSHSSFHLHQQLVYYKFCYYKHIFAQNKYS